MFAFHPLGGQDRLQAPQRLRLRYPHPALRRHGHRLPDGPGPEHPPVRSLLCPDLLPEFWPEFGDVRAARRVLSEPYPEHLPRTVGFWGEDRGAGGGADVPGDQGGVRDRGAADRSVDPGCPLHCGCGCLPSLPQARLAVPQPGGQARHRVFHSGKRQCARPDELAPCWAALVGSPGACPLWGIVARPPPGGGAASDAVTGKWGHFARRGTHGGGG
mmetsp:Transcript_37091/g.97172  ORF Transcript_37091/g.97172 Transcript_37091/m.97172 type:complete len:216 (+) Transcript_37091:1027-1674(+)